MKELKKNKKGDREYHSPFLIGCFKLLVIHWLAF